MTKGILDTDTVFIPITKLIAPLKKLVSRAPAVMPPRLAKIASATIIAEQYGEEVLKEDPVFASKLGALALKSRGQPATYMIRPSASHVVEDTDLCSIPSEPPPLLRSPGIIEARRPETGERLWEDVVSLAWYEVTGAERTPPQLLPAIMLFGQCWPNRTFAARWQPVWTGEDLDEQMPPPDWGVNLLDSIEVFEHRRYAKAAARFLVIFGLLEQIVEGPLRFEIDKKTKTREVRVRDRQAPSAAPASVETHLGDPSKRVLGDTTVRGHLRRVRIGEGRTGIRWKYINDHRAKRWFAQRYTVERNYDHPGLANEELIYRGKKPE
jgi:hypothetical protein